MPAYLKFFELELSPFEGKAQAQLILGTKALREAFAVIQHGLDGGDTRICVSGGPGLGKTSLARALPKLLGDTARVATVLNPGASWESLRGSIAKQWHLASGGLARKALIEAARDRRLVLVIDQAELASDEFLDHLDVILSYRSADDEPVVQSVLFARLSGGVPRQGPAPIVWWLDHIQTLQLEFSPLSRAGIESYIQKRLQRAGWQGNQLFSNQAALAIYEYTSGIPGEVSQLCERLLSEAATQNLNDIDADFVRSVCDQFAGDPFEYDIDKPDDETDFEDEFELAAARDPREEVFGDSEPTARSDEASIDAREAFSRSEEPAALAEDDGKMDLPIEDRKEDHLDVPIEASTADDPASEQAVETRILTDETLSLPAQLEAELAVFRHAFAHSPRIFAAATIAIAVVVGGLVFAWPGGDSDVSDPIATGRSPLVDPKDSESAAGSQTSTLVLARLRGPVLPPENTPDPFEIVVFPSPEVSIASEPDLSVPDLRLPLAGRTGIAEAGSFEVVEEDLEDFVPEDDLVDLRPASMLPYPSEESLPEEPF